MSIGFDLHEGKKVKGGLRCARKGKLGKRRDKDEEAVKYGS